MRLENKGWLCSYCSDSTRTRCEAKRRGDPEAILDIRYAADSLGARYDLYASGNCIFKFTARYRGVLAHG